MADIVTSLLGVQGLEVKAGGDALIQLAKPRAGQQAAQLRLPHQEDLQQFLLWGFQIGEQTDLLQHLGTQVLCLIDHQHRAPTIGMSGEQKGVDAIHELLAGALASRGPGCGTRRRPPAAVQWRRPPG